MVWLTIGRVARLGGCHDRAHPVSSDPVCLGELQPFGLRGIEGCSRWPFLFSLPSLYVLKVGFLLEAVYVESNGVRIRVNEKG